MARKLPVRMSWSDGGTRAVVMEAVEPCHEGWSCEVLARLGAWPWVVMAQPTMRTGRQVYGVAVHYRHQLRGTTVHRDQTTYPLPPRWAERTKVVALPQGAKELALTDQPPKGPLMAVT
jgi:hypothetical protein